MTKRFGSSIKVFGLGLSKTGTTSLGDALNLLGIKTIHYPFDSNTYNELRSGNYNLSILKKYQAIVDTPVAPFYAQLDKVFPGSKFILTVREIESWLRSIKKHREVMGKRKSSNPDFERFREFMGAVVYGSLGFNEDRYRFVYETHLKNVLNYFENRPDDLMVIDICKGEGWGHLCSFLSVPVPDVSFPHSNQRLSSLTNITKDVEQVIPAGGTFILVDSDFYGEDIAIGRTCIPLMEWEGVFLGLPPDSAAAINEVERLVTKYNPQHLVFAWPSFWWFDHYKDFSNYLRSQFNCVFNNERLVVFGLHGD